LLSINTGTKSGDKLLATNSRKLLWDEDNHLLASNDNGFVTSYFYDAGGERTVKMSGDGEGVQVNGVLSGIRNGTTNFTAYISPYLIVRNGGEYTKHIYMGGQRIVSKVSDSGIFNISPVNTNDLQAKYTAQTASLKARYDSLGVAYNGAQQTGGLVSKSPTGDSGSEYFYHPDHLGSSSLISDAGGNLIQHLEYVPYGETFIDERNGSWHTPYQFNGKERDEETGLLYYGARYQDGKYGIWYSVDPLAEKYPNMGSYVYCADNPVKYVDPDGKKWDKSLWNKATWWNSPYRKLSYGYSHEHFFNPQSANKTHIAINELNKSNLFFQRAWKDVEASHETYKIDEGADGGVHTPENGSFTPGTNQIILIAGKYTKSTVFEEVFHAGQNEFYKGSRSQLSNEVEAHIAKALSGLEPNQNLQVDNKKFGSIKTYIDAVSSGTPISADMRGNAETSLKEYASTLTQNGYSNLAGQVDKFDAKNALRYIENIIKKK
jgi:RHS repeat-associated protein